jgi:hypothetical protein
VSEEPNPLADELSAFLAGVKVAETLTPDLRAAITVPTGLEEALRTAVAARRDVIVAGSAGGGKTHLLHALDESHETSNWPDGPTPTADFVRIVPDATVVIDAIRARDLLERPPNCVAEVIAINEGPLLELAREQSESMFARGVPLLHDAQRGRSGGSSDPAAPVVIDVGGYDPVENGVVGRLLALPLLKDLVMNLVCSCEDASICPRRLAWLQLESEEARSRVNDVLRLANVAGRPLLFRDIWDFIADVALGGSCDSDPPTSPWFWRIFNGRSLLSAHLRAVADPSLVVYPRAEAHVWWGDWTAEEIELVDDVELVPLVTDPPYAGDRYRWLKAQLFFAIHAQSILSVLRDQVNLEMLTSLGRERVGEVVAVLNDYMCYGTRPQMSQRLELWIDMGVERRLDRARGQASLGRVPVSELEIARSSAVANHPDPNADVPGSRVFLVHPASGASFGLSADALNLLRSGRSFRISDRPHTDMEWQIADFYAAIGVDHSDVHELSVLQLQFDAMTGDVRTYLVAPSTRTIELSSD